MAKKEKLKLDEYNIDDDLDFSSFDESEITGGLSPEARDSKKRTPVMDVFRGTISGAKSTVKSPAYPADLTKKSLPSSYGEVFKAADDVRETTSALYDEAVRELKPQLSYISKKIDRLVPDEQKFLKKVSAKISGLFGNNDSYKGPSKEQIQDQSITAALGQIFDKKQELEHEAEARTNVENKVKDQVEKKRFESNFGLLSSINEGITRQTQYTERITQAYQKKSLELQFRSYFVQAELLQVSNKYFEVFRNQNEAIAKNTALPEFVKINNSERFKDIARNKFFTSIQDSLFGQDSWFGQLAKKLKADGKQYISGIKQGLEGAASGLDSAEELREINKTLAESGMAPLSKAEMAGNTAGSYLANKASDWVGNKARPWLSKNKAVAKFGNRSATAVMNPGGALDDWQNSDKFMANKDKEGVLGWLFRAADKAINYSKTSSPDMRVDNPSGIAGVEMGSIFNGRTQRSIVEIIPGYLSRILREVTSMRTGDDQTSSVLFDHTSGKFVDKKEVGKSIRKTLNTRINQSMYSHRMDQTASSFLNRDNISDQQKKKVGKFFSQISTIPDMNYTSENIMKTRVFASLDKDTQKLIKDQLEASQGNPDDAGESLMNLTRDMGNLKQATPDIRGEIEQFIKMGYGEILEEQGLVSQDSDNNYHIDQKAYMDLLAGDGSVSSDRNVKKGIKPLSAQSVLSKMRSRSAMSRRRNLVKSDVFSKEAISAFRPGQALDAIKKTKIYKWFYKDGQGDGLEHSGPMAQDVNKNMGEDAAPGGTKIDLTTMNGNNMAAIQALDQKLEQVKRSTSGDTGVSHKETVLDGIKQDTSKIVMLLESSGTRGSSAGVSSGDGYKSLLGTILDSTASLMGKVGTDLSKSAKTVFTFTKDKIVKPGSSKISGIYDRNKEPVANAFKSMLAKAGELASQAMEVGQDVVFNKLPMAMRQAAVLGNTLKEKLKEWINGARDVYIKGRESPVLKASLIRAGYYRDQVTNKVIKTMDDLKDLKGNIISPDGNVVLTIEEAAEGLYDRYGERIKSIFGKISSAVGGYAIAGFQRAKNFWRKAAPAGVGLLGRVKGMFGKAKDALFSKKGQQSEDDSGYDFGFGTGKIYDVLVEIRDIISSKMGGGSIASSIRPSQEEFMGPQRPTEPQADLGPRYSGNGSAISSALNAGRMMRGMIPGAMQRLRGMRDSARGAKGIKGKFSAAFGSMFGNRGEDAPADQGPMDNTQQNPSILDKASTIYNTLTDKAKSITQNVKDKVTGAGSGAFNDRDGSGRRDGDWRDRIDAMDKRKQANKKDPLQADLQARYKSEQSIIASIMEKASGIFDLAKGGLGSIFGAATSLLGGGGGLLAKLAGGVKGLAGAGGAVLGGIKGAAVGAGALLGKLATPFSKAGKAVGTSSRVGRLMTAGRIVGTVGKVGAMAVGGLGSAAVGAASTTIAALSAVATAPVILGALAVGAVGYGAYRAYKHITRNDVNKFENIRMKQYGLGFDANSSSYNNLMLKLEEYLESSCIGYNQGKAHILEKKINNEELLSIFKIVKSDDQAVSNFTRWFQSRFKPFFLTHLTALFSINNKAKLAEVDKMSPEDKVKYLQLTKFEEGPYSEVTSPIKEISELSASKESVFRLHDELISEIKVKKQTDSKQPIPKEAPAPPKAQGLAPEVPRPLPNTNIGVSKPKGASDPKDILSSGEGDGPTKDGVRLPGAQTSMGSGTAGLVQAGGPMRDGDGAAQYLVLQPGVKIDGANPALLKNFKAMVQEYGETTGKKIIVTSGYRSTQEQEALYRKNPRKAARPGRSLHEFGLALDVNSTDLDALDKAGLMRKYGFTRPVGGEPWHMEPAGIQVDLARARNDPSFAQQAIDASLFKGGAGIGSMRGAPKEMFGRRDPAMALALLQGNAKQVAQSVQSDKDRVASLATVPKPEALDAVKPNTTTASGSSGTITMASTAGVGIAQGASRSATSVSQQTNQSERYSKTESLVEREEKPTINVSQAANDQPIDPSNRTEVRNAIESIAKKQNLDPEMMSAFAAVESSLNPMAKAPNTSATGLFQFTKATWNEQMSKNARKHGLDPSTSPTDIKASTLMASEYIKSNRRALTSVRPNPSITDIYLTHFLGAGGARRLLSADPQAIAEKILPSAAKHNPTYFYNKGVPLTVAEVYDRINNRIVKTASDFGISIQPGQSLNTAAQSRPTDRSTAVQSASMNGPVAPKPSLTTGTVSSNRTVPTQVNTPADRTSVFKPQQATVISGAGQSSGMQGMTTGTSDFTEVNSTLSKQLSVQQQMLEVLKTISDKVGPQQFNQIKEAIGEMNTASQSNQQTRGPSTQMSSVKSAIDLRRKVA